MNLKDARLDSLMKRLLAEDVETYTGKIRADLGRLWQVYLKPFRRNIILAVIVTFFWSLHPYGMHLLNRFLVDHILALGQTTVPVLAVQLQRLRLYGLLLLGLWTAFVIAHWTRSSLILSVGERLVSDMRRDLHDKLNRLHVAYFESQETGKIMSRVLEDVWVIREWSTNQFITIVAHVLRLSSGLVVLMFVEWRLALLLTVSLPVYALFTIRIRPLIRRLNISLRRLNASMYALTQERIAGVAVVKAFGQENREKQRFALRVNNNIRLGMNVIRYQGLLNLCTGSVTALMSGAIPLFGIHLYRRGFLTVGDVMLFIFSMGNIYFQVNQLAGYYVQVHAVLVVLKRVFNVLDEEEAVRPGTATFSGSDGSIHFDHVSFAYPGLEKTTLKDVSFNIPPGSKVALMGPSGAGKSSVFQLLCRFYLPQSGNILVGGVNLADADPVALRRHAVMVQQEPVIFSGSVADNIAYSRSEAGPREIMRAARLAEMHDFIMTLPAKYETEVGQNGITLSGGQKQRLALATALLTDPAILLLDDTTSALDAETESRIRATLDKVLAGRTSITITQRIATARTCDWIIVLENGRVQDQGSHDQLRARGGFYAKIIEQQESHQEDPARRHEA
jgi:ABC-type multidrug transport system fused ATPase/permease subunit